MFNGTVSKQLLDQFDRIRELPQEVLLRLVVIYFTLVFLIVPDFVAGYLLMDDVFRSKELKIMENALFEGLVLGVVFLFAMTIIYAMSAGNRRLQYVVMGVSFCLVLFSGAFMGQVSNTCIPNSCDEKLYYLSLGVISLINIVALLLPSVIGFRVPAFGVVFVAVAVWQSDLWLWISLNHVGIAPSPENIRGVVLLLFSMLWIGVFALMAVPKREIQEY